MKEPIAEEEIISEWTTSIEALDLPSIQALFDVQPSLLWTPLKTTSRYETDFAHFIQHLKEYKLLGTSIKPVYALHYILFDCGLPGDEWSVERTEIAEFILENTKGNELNTCVWGAEQNTVMHLAFLLNQPELTQQLLKHNASVSIPNKLGHLPTEYNKPMPKEKIPSNTSDKFKRLKELAESPSTQPNKTNMERQNSTRRYFRPGHLEERKRRVLGEEDEDEPKSARQKDIQLLAQRSAVKNNPLFKKFEEQDQPVKTAAAIVRDRKLLNAVDQIKRSSRVINSLKQNSYVTSSIFRQQAATLESKPSSISREIKIKKSSQDTTHTTTDNAIPKTDENQDLSSMTSTSLDSDQHEKTPVHTLLHDQHPSPDQVQSLSIATHQKDENRELRPVLPPKSKSRPLSKRIEKKNPVRQPLQVVHEQPETVVTENTNDKPTHDSVEIMTISTFDDMIHAVDQTLHDLCNDKETSQQDTTYLEKYPLSHMPVQDQSSYIKDTSEHLQPVCLENISNERQPIHSENKQHQFPVQEIAEQRQIFHSETTMEQSQLSRLEEVQHDDFHAEKVPTTIKNTLISKPTEQNQPSPLDATAEKNEPSQLIIEQYHTSHLEDTPKQHQPSHAEKKSTKNQSLHTSEIAEQDQSSHLDNMVGKNQSSQSENISDHHQSLQVEDMPGKLQSLHDKGMLMTNKSLHRDETDKECHSLHIDETVEENQSSHSKDLIEQPRTSQLENSPVNTQSSHTREVVEQAQSFHSQKTTEHNQLAHSEEVVKENQSLDPSFIPDQTKPSLSKDMFEHRQSSHLEIILEASDFETTSEQSSTSSINLLHNHSSSSLEEGDTIPIQLHIESRFENDIKESIHHETLYIDSDTLHHPSSTSHVEENITYDSISLDNDNSKLNTSHDANKTEVAAPTPRDSCISLSKSEESEAWYDPDEWIQHQRHSVSSSASLSSTYSFKQSNSTEITRMDDDEGEIIVYIDPSISQQQQHLDVYSQPLIRVPSKTDTICDVGQAHELEELPHDPQHPRIADISHYVKELPTHPEEENEDGGMVKRPKSGTNEETSVPNAHEIACEEPTQIVCSEYGKLYIGVSGAHHVLLPLPKEPTYVRCVVSDGAYEYMSRYELLTHQVEMEYECVIDTKPGMIITISLHVRQDPHVRRKTGWSKWFTSIRKQKEHLSGYVYPEDGAIGQTRFAVDHMIPGCYKKMYQSYFDCFNSWYARTYQERARREKFGEEEDFLKIVGKLNVSMLYLPVTSPSVQIPKTLRECDLTLKICQWHETCWQSGYLSTRQQGAKVWERHYYRLIGSQLIGYTSDGNEFEVYHYFNISDVIRLSAAADKVIVSLVEEEEGRIFTDSIHKENNERGFFRLSFKHYYVDCVCDTIEESEQWVKTLKSMIGHVQRFHYILDGIKNIF